MSSCFWHLKSANVMLKIAQDELYNNDYVTINASLKALEEIIDAYCANHNIHFHDEPNTAWKNRIEWIEKNEEKKLYNEFYEIMDLISFFFRTKDECYLEQTLSMIKRNINVLQIRSK
ncbi:MAG: hypothetical protein ACPKQO_05670 [Nitrososphaeraceae archaeon]